MCLAVYKPAGVSPDIEALREGFENNDHGAGFAHVSHAGVRIRKGFFDFDSFLEVLKMCGTDQMILHFRLATHGKKDVNNCHPFRVSHETVMIHNGTISVDCNLQKDMSDTWHYTRKVLRPLAKITRDFYRDEAIKFLVAQSIGGSKLVFLRDDGDFGIVNETAGHWHKDCWWSNKSYEKVPAWMAAAWPPKNKTEFVYQSKYINQFRLQREPDIWRNYRNLLDDGWRVRELDDLITAYGLSEITRRASLIGRELTVIGP